MRFGICGTGYEVCGMWFGVCGVRYVVYDLSSVNLKTRENDGGFSKVGGLAVGQRVGC